MTVSIITSTLLRLNLHSSVPVSQVWIREIDKECLPFRRDAMLPVAIGDSNLFHGAVIEGRRFVTLTVRGPTWVSKDGKILATWEVEILLLLRPTVHGINRHQEPRQSRCWLHITPSEKATIWDGIVSNVNAYSASVDPNWPQKKNWDWKDWCRLLSIVVQNFPGTTVSFDVARSFCCIQLYPFKSCRISPYHWMSCNHPFLLNWCFSITLNAIELWCIKWDIANTPQ